MENKIFIPFVAVTPPPVVKSKARIAFEELCIAEGQQRPSLVWDDCLALAAGIRADNISIEWGHCFRGNCANRIVRAVCPLPSDYPENGNSVESIIGGVDDPLKALKFLLASPSHADHLLGRTDFFRVQNRAGVAFLQREGSPYTFYYVFLISK